MRLSCTLAALALLVPLAVAFSGLGHDLKRQTCAWSFDESKGNGPSNWGTICNGAYPVCASGQQQSPIDVITSNDIERPLSNRKITVKYPELVEAEFENTGYTLEVVTPLTALAYVTVAGLGNFDLLQFHFHTPSEHRLNGAIYPAEMHLVHKSKAGVYTVIGFFIAEGTDNSVLTPLIDNLANVNDAKENITLDRLTLENLITSAFTYYSYNGSFTTPPCTEGVNWVLSDTPLFVSNSQLTALVAALKGAASAPSSNRPAQPLNGRLVTTYIASAGALSVSALLGIMLAVVALML